MAENVIYRNLFSMGTTMDMIFLGIQDEEADSVFFRIKAELERIEQKLSIYIADSDFSKINKLERNEEFVLDKEMNLLLEDLYRFYSLSYGKFDYSLGKIYSGDLGLEESRAFLDLSIDERLSHNAQSSVLILKDQNTSLDSNGFGKGFALDSVKKILKTHNINHSFISFGGSSVMGLGRHAAVDYWPVGIADFQDSTKNMYVFQLRDSFLSVSGNTINNKEKYPKGHILNPVTGKLLEGLQQLCVEGPSAFVTEILSTALFAASPDERMGIINNFPGYRAVKLTFDEDNNKNIIEEYRPENE